MRKLFKNKWVSSYLGFGDFAVPNIVHYKKIINKTRTIKNQENSARRFGENYLSVNVTKILHFYKF